MSVIITDSDTLAISLDDSSKVYNLGPPATYADVTMEYMESLGNGLPSATITHLYMEELGNGDPTAIITNLYWETMVSVNHSTQIESDTLGISFTETTIKYIKDYDTLNIVLAENDPYQILDIEPKILPANQTFVLLYVLGFGFKNTSQIVFGGKPLITAFVSPTQITAKVPSKLISLGNISINVILN